MRGANHLGTALSISVGNRKPSHPFNAARLATFCLPSELQFVVVCIGWYDILTSLKSESRTAMPVLVTEMTRDSLDEGLPDRTLPKNNVYFA